MRGGEPATLTFELFPRLGMPRCTSSIFVFFIDIVSYKIKFHVGFFNYRRECKNAIEWRLGDGWKEVFAGAWWSLTLDVTGATGSQVGCLEIRRIGCSSRIEIVI